MARRQEFDNTLSNRLNSNRKNLPPNLKKLCRESIQTDTGNTEYNWDNWGNSSSS